MANEKKTLTPEEKQAQDAARIARKQALSMHIRALRRVLIVSASAVLIAFMVLFYAPRWWILCWSLCARAASR